MSQAERSPFSRAAALERLGSEQFDVLVIGGGITGAGVALDAAARGLRTAVVEGRDWAAGTSSKSSKLVHGGLRYLQQKEYRLVYENLYERQRLIENAPHLVSPLPFLIPLFGKQGTVNKAVAKAYRTALWLYDLTGGVRIGHRHRRMSHDEALKHLPTLRTDLLAAAFLYWDAQTDDARLTLAIVRTAVVEHGAVAANYSPVKEILHGPGGEATGARLAEGTVVRARVIVNAAGVWTDDVRELDEGEHPDSLRPAKGIHLTVPAAKLPCDIAAVVPVPRDRRSIFVVPWGEHTYIGTTDTEYHGTLDDPQVTPEDVDYVLGAINTWVTDPIRPEDVTGSWAGLRPLVKGEAKERTADLSRRHAVSTSPSGVVTITGGKLTTYRRMAADAIDAASEVLGHGVRKSPTKNLRIRGAVGVDDLRKPDAASRAGVDAGVLAHLVRRYGSEAGAVADLVRDDPSLGEPLVPGLPYLRAEAVFAARHEMAHTLDDVLARRTRALLLGRDAMVAAALDVAKLVALELGWDDAEIARQVEDVTAIAEHERTTAGLPHTAAPSVR
ncbi:MAG TPA: glycerol-3-phosphate dehydrogenase/oxidase [Acidimicrobiales bacterium]